MGLRGPAPKPAAVRLYEGNLGKRPLNPLEPRPRVVEPSCPSHLDADARRVWLAVEHLDTPRFRARMVEWDDARAEYIMPSESDALGSVQWLDPKPRPERIQDLVEDLERWFIEIECPRQHEAAKAENAARSEREKWRDLASRHPMPN
ncbi:MAG: hypothetical protein ABI972_19425 [Acidobacteriota bacterium]